METETKVSLAVALILVLTSFVDLRISAILAIVYLIAYGVNRMRKARKQRKTKQDLESDEAPYGRDHSPRPR